MWTRKQTVKQQSETNGASLNIIKNLKKPKGETAKIMEQNQHTAPTVASMCRKIYRLAARDIERALNNLFLGRNILTLLQPQVSW